MFQFGRQGRDAASKLLPEQPGYAKEKCGLNGELTNPDDRLNNELPSMMFHFNRALPGSASSLAGPKQDIHGAWGGTTLQKKFDGFHERIVFDQTDIKPRLFLLQEPLIDPQRVSNDLCVGSFVGQSFHPLKAFKCVSRELELNAL